MKYENLWWHYIYRQLLPTFRRIWHTSQLLTRHYKASSNGVAVRGKTASRFPHLRNHINPINANSIHDPIKTRNNNIWEILHNPTSLHHSVTGDASFTSSCSKQNNSYSIERKDNIYI
ncbi:hypothetical protein, unlikely [Trypanosoma brucei gambiense DAL972]|uniref:Uncharacterized protein n=1 Tax=Trypanosoma brucei gambiense (strain MHOM/CI/86/DAL972) TaxID=679716 RepID=C9ZY59_TRYB9|nr:hypothetical protein, unlikely [Trypanosoma brucei gambiense DAL972]CBH14358.1 hypothetical protein, unlikely [Trypanosoma brucei gambiense DAL972]|eukprot:XP_011776624.1 hypothetical protein, unlikely [Trypanosoma brucei gambiense DAL972]